MHHPFKKSIIVLVAAFFLISSSIHGANPSAPLLPSDNIQDPGALSTPWGGCGPTDSNCYVTNSTEVSSLTDATAATVLDNTDYTQEWQWSTLSGSGLKLTSNSTLAAGNAQKLFDLSLSGANATAGQTTYGASIANTHTGTGSVNVGLYVTASGGDDNYAAIFEDGFVGIGTTTPETELDVVGTITASEGLATNGVTFQADTSNNILIGVNNPFSGYDNFFVGSAAGNLVTNVYRSVFIGASAGAQAGSAQSSNFIGAQAGQLASAAANSNFFGNTTGFGATNAENANFFGANAGFQATNAAYSNIIGYQAGYQASAASYSNLFGFQAGRAFSGNNIGANNIIIGTNISLPNGVANALNIGGVLFGTGLHSSPVGDPSVTFMANAKIGIGVVAPSYTLQVGNNIVSGVVARFENSTGTCDINPTSSSLTCSSDMRLKKNIEPIELSVVSLIQKLRPVTYNWNAESSDDPTHPGFIAQEVETILPQLVTTDPKTGLKSVNYTGFIPYTIAAFQEINVRVQSLPVFEDQNLALKVADFLRGIASGVATVGKVQTDELCVGATCVTEERLQQLLELDTNKNTHHDNSPAIEEEQIPEEQSEEVGIENDADEPISDEVVPEVEDESTDSVPSTIDEE